MSTFGRSVKSSFDKALYRYHKPCFVRFIAALEERLHKVDPTAWNGKPSDVPGDDSLSHVTGPRAHRGCWSKPRVLLAFVPRSIPARSRLENHEGNAGMRRNLKKVTRGSHRASIRARARPSAARSIVSILDVVARYLGLRIRRMCWNIMSTISVGNAATRKFILLKICTSKRLSSMMWFARNIISKLRLLRALTGPDTSPVSRYTPYQPSGGISGFSLKNPWRRCMTRKKVTWGELVRCTSWLPKATSWERPPLLMPARTLHARA